METAMCRICLAKNVRMNWIVNTELQHVYETLTNHVLETGARPLVACYICFAQLQHCYQLSVRCLKAEEILTKIINGDQDCYDAENNSLNPIKILSVTPITHYTFPDVFTSENTSYNTHVKEEPVSEDDDNEGITRGEVEVKFEVIGVQKTEPSPEPDLCESTSQVVEEHYQKPCRSSEDELPHASLSDIQKLDTNNETGHIGKDKTAIQKRVPVSKMCRNTVSPRMAPDECSSKHCFQCDICQMSFNQKSYYMSHIQTHAGDKCSIPQNSNNCKNDSDKHTQIHKDQQPHKCIVCQKSFSRKDNLKSHIRIHTGDKPFKCEICQKRFTVKDHLKKHSRIHTGWWDKPFQCDICQKSFNEKSNLVSHIQTHGQPYQCALPENSYLDERTQIYCEQNPYRCNICEKTFSAKSTLKRHIRIQNSDKPDSLVSPKIINDKPYKCHVCQKDFCEKGTLKRHIRIHTGKKPYKCDQCQKSFYQKATLKRHTRVHTGDKPYTCDICQKSYSAKPILLSHIRIHTGDKPYKCKVCQKSFSEMGNLKKHIRIHTGDKPYKCDVCQKSFTQQSNLTNHLRLHTGDKPYRCDVCQKCFTQPNGLRSHMRKHIGTQPKESGV